MSLMLNTVVALNAQQILEFGTDVGDSGRIFTEGLKQTGGELTTVDIRECSQTWAEGHPRVHFVVQDSRLFSWSQPIDLLFLDDHFEEMDIYAHLIYELERFGVWVRPGGYILIHDTSHTVYGPGIIRAIRTWCLQRKLRWTEDVQGQGLGMIQVSRALEH